MSKRKNYTTLFLNYCIKNDIWFSVYSNGCVDEITDTNRIDGGEYAREGVKFGTKAAYEWLLKAHKEMQE